MISKEDSKSVLIVAAEDSSTLYAQRLLEHWQAEGKCVDAFGIGSQAMEKIGFEAIGHSEELAVVGVQEVMAHWGEIKSTFHRVLAEAASRKPKFALLLDYPEFNLRLAKKLKALGIPVIYYISPQIWAWRKGRVKIMKKYVDKVLTLFPFENRFYEENGVDVNFVGHPLLDELNRQDFGADRRKVFRQKYGVAEDQLVVGLMPGSRNSEILHHLSVQLKTAEKVYENNDNIRIFLLVAPGLEVEKIKEQLGEVDFPITIIKNEPMVMIHLTDMILCASGTATMMVGLLKKPMVIMYRMNSITAFIAKRLVRHSQFFGMVNLILGREVVPERFQERANAEELSGLLQKYIDEKTFYSQTVEQLAELKLKLGDLGATKRVAESLEVYLA